ncbi:seryl-tRNA synthetase, also charges selenocysteinyl-tRNA with serine [Roseovarius sp. EC-HK134]|uniref:Serine--tRNA ligase n=1 Tax=Roseovarius mucosus TaxID=215743 RepID=A0A1V0RKJ7_9RHOB|nr:MULTISPECIES: serine--tRNA ligase [Roseovarius]ARE82298.1 serine--tRNA ligase [Roseovarius mucosus]AWZ22377.1 Seryl-tRNA synthetase [Roseovarius sp. AK1035]EDM30659.1 seryl-tRNA synthetase [Roseovarius sp. TM1035]MBW4972621.1 serine--tRNA ligase [Roseovarius mucosus]VVT32260.1 seryl-tRNA synthetase, also charges selenocysteinyl-tRNA with serine [Roseovarius sp. EC-HK134]
MHDIRAIRETPDAFDAALARRGLAPVSPQILALDEARRTRIHAAESAQADQNRASKEAGAAKGRGDEAEFERLRTLVSAKKEEMAAMQAEAKALDTQLTDLLMALPNLPFDDVPDGTDESGNVELRRWGTPASFDFTPKEHYDITGVQPGMDFETAAKLSGARFVVLSGSIARLHRALAQFMLDTHIEENGLQETWTPVLVRPEMMLGTGQLPKFGEDSYETTNGWWLVPTAEVTLTNIVHGETVDAATLPRRYVAHTQCFRSEAGSAGRDTAGMLRQHQFEKVEMVSITHPDESRAELDRMTACAQSILERLGLPYRTIVLCTGDMGFGARRTHDIEVWLPGQNTYREISSVSVCGDFQARRMNARFKPQGGGKPEFLHTLNGSGLAVGRCLIAVLENGQQADGSVRIPDALHPYLRGKTILNADGSLG